jgi:hypothetical protein
MCTRPFIEHNTEITHREYEFSQYVHTHTHTHRLPGSYFTLLIQPSSSSILASSLPNYPFLSSSSTHSISWKYVVPRLIKTIW